MCRPQWTALGRVLPPPAVPGLAGLSPRWLWVAVWSGLLVWCGLDLWLRAPAHAAEQAEVEYAKGLVAYDERDYLAALDHFRQAVALDPDNPHAHFYVGLSLSRTGDFPEAMAALQQALQLDPSLHYIHYHLGMAYFQESRYPQALEQFTLAEQFDPQKAATQFYLGYTHYLLKHYNQALPLLQRAIQLDATLLAEAQYYRGVALYTLERDTEARAAFQDVTTAEPGSTTAGNAQRYLAALASREREQRLWQVGAETSLQFDDNVVLESSGQVVDFGRRADSSALFSLTARLLPVRTPVWRVGAEYALFQSLHFTLHNFDIQSHTATLFTRLKWREVTWRVAADYTYTLLDAARFAEEVSVLPSVSFWESETLYTVASVRYRASRFFNQDISSGAEAVRDRNGWTTRAGFDQYLLFNNKRSVGRFSYHFEVSRNHGTDWEYNGHQLGLGLQTPLWWGLTLYSDGAYQHRPYLHVNSFDAPPLGTLDATDRRARRDDILIGSVVLGRDLGRYLTLFLAFTHTSNLSNVAFFNYHRNLTTLSLSGRY